MPSKPKTIKELKEQRRRENFVGRTEQQQVFTENFAADEPKWVVLSVTGEGGVGKSTLLKRYTQLAQGDEIKANVVYCDDRQYTPVDAMAVIAEQLEKLGIESKKFNERYKKYRETLQQIESDPTAPRGMVNVVTRGLTDFTIKSLRRVPGVGVAADYVDEKAAGDAMADLAQYAFTRWGNKDETLLVREPEKILTPLFVELLNEATEKQRLVVMFDVFERTSSTLSSWIIELVDGKHGDFSSWASFIVSGRDPLEQHWTELAGLMSHVQLEPFTLDETAIYLSNQNIKDEMLVKQIYEDTGGLPVLVELLASTKPQPGVPLPDISRNAVERFLQWTPDEEKRHAALIASVPRQFNQEILQAVLGQDKGKELFYWLAGQSFVRSNTERGYFYHDKVRVLMLRHQKNITPGELSATHAALAGHFTTVQAELGLQGKEAYENQAWRRLELERVYHHVSVDPEKHFANALDSFLNAILHRLKFSRTVVRTSAQAMADNQCNMFDENLGELEQLVDFYEKNDYQQIKELAGVLQAAKEISATSQFICFSLKGYGNFHLKQYEEALADYTRAIELDEKNAIAIASRGQAYGLINRYEEALADFTRAIELDEKYAGAIALRGATYQLMKRYEEALADFTRAIELDEKYAGAIALRGGTYRSMKRYEEALADFTRAIELDEKYTGTIGQRALTYYLMGNFDQALQDFSRRLELDEKDMWSCGWRGEVYRSMGQYGLALLDLTKLVDAGKADPDDTVRRAATYIPLGDTVSAQKDLDFVLSFECKKTVDHYGRGLALILSNRTPESFAEFEIAFADSFFRQKSRVDNLLDPIRDLPEFKALLARFE